MLGRDYQSENCSIARALEAVGERWSLLILRDAVFRGVTQFSEFQRSLGIASNVLSTRLAGFVSQGLLVQDDAGYHPSAKARDLVPALLALTQWGDRWAAPHGAPVIYRAAAHGRLSVDVVDETGRAVDPRDVEIVAAPGPGSRSTSAGKPIEHLAR